MKKVKVNKEACIGCGSCVAICPSVYEFDEEGFAKVIDTVDFNKLDKDTEVEVIDAKESCPTGAIEFTE